jgi:hypothetical protein
MFSATSSFIIYGSEEHLQLALPKQISASVSKQKITNNELLSCYRDFFLFKDCSDREKFFKQLISQKINEE